MVTIPNNWQPRGYQLPAWSALEAGKKKVLLFWHRRAGKDDLCLHWTATQIVQRVGNYWHMLPEQNQARKAIWNAVNPHTGQRRIDEAFPRELRETTRDDEMLIRFKNGSSWQVVGSDNYNSLVGSAPVGVVFSEFAIAKPEAWAYIRPIMAENDGWALFITTARGKNHAHQLYEMAKTSDDWYAQVLPATKTDVFTPEQLNKERIEYQQMYGSALGNALFEQEYLCSFDTALLGAVWGEEVAKLKSDGRYTPLTYDNTSPVHTVWDLGYGDATAIWFAQRVGRELRLIDYHEDRGKGLDHYIGVLQNKGYVYAKDWLPHDGRNASVQTGLTSQDVLRKMGRNVDITPSVSLDDGINAARSLLSRVVICSNKCAKGMDCLTNYRWGVNKETMQTKPTPVHDWASDGADAFRYVAINEMSIASPYQIAKKIKLPKLNYA